MRKEKSRYDIVAPVIRHKKPYGLLRFNLLGEWVPSGDLMQYMVINDKTPKSYKNAMETIAFYFKREFGYDFVQYCADGIIGSDRPILLFQNEIHRCDCVGGVHFVHERPKDSPPYYFLSWVWIHPYKRNNGILSLMWAMLREMCGDFLVCPPLSKAMDSFLRKRQECWKHYKSCPADCNFLKSSQPTPI